VSETAQRQRCNLGHIVIVKPVAQFQHRGNSFQKNTTALWRNAGGGSHDDVELFV
jgi:hypothetical protein